MNNDRKDSSDADKKRQTSLLSPLQAHTAPTTPRRLPRPATGPLTSHQRLLFQVGDGAQTTIGIAVKDTILVGRADPIKSLFPDLDLTPYGGQEGGVSRQHARITYDAERQTLFIEDLKSTNGTRLNGFWLEAEQRYRLHDGDELELGRVKITLRFKLAALE